MVYLHILTELNRLTYLPQQAHIELIKALYKSKKTVRVFINADYSTDFFEECLRTMNRQLVMDFYFSKACIKEIEARPFILNKLFELKARGVTIYLADESEYTDHYKWICQIDFNSTFALNASETLSELDYSRAEEIFYSLHLKSSEYRVNNPDFKAEFESQSYNVIKGKSTTISWDVKEADSVWIDGFGEVSASGKRVIQILDNTLLTLKASNKKERKFKAIYLRSIDRLEINFDVLFLNPASKKFVSLKTEDDSDGVFGVSKDHKIKVVWNVQHAETVEVEPFGVNTKSGEYTFMPEGTSEINIKAGLQEQTINQRIIIYPYPMRIFNEKLIDIKSDFYAEAKFSYKDIRSQAYSFINKKKKLDSLDELKAKVYEQEKMLYQKFENLKFSKFYEEHSITKLNNSILGRLKAYFSDKPEVRKMLDTLQQYKDVE